MLIKKRNVLDSLDSEFQGKFLSSAGSDTRDIKQRQAARTPYVVFVVASHYQSLQIVVLLLQACLLGSLALSRTLLLQ